MVTSGQITRGVFSTIRAIDRNAKRAQRSYLAAQAAAEKQERLEAASAAATAYENYVEALTGAHRMNFAPINWRAVAERPERAKEAYADTRERRARATYDTYTPGWFARTFKQVEKRRAKLAAAIDHARDADLEAHLAHCHEVDAHNSDINAARTLLDRDRERITNVLNHKTRLGDLPYSIEGARLLFLEDGRIAIIANGLDLEDMPQDSVTRLQSGRVSVKPLPHSRLLEMHLANICSAAIRVAIEVLQAAPLEVIEVVMETDLLDSATGHIESRPVLHVKISAQVLQSINLNQVDPVALVERLEGTMNWNRSSGFKAISWDDFGSGKI